MMENLEGDSKTFDAVEQIINGDELEAIAKDQVNFEKFEDATIGDGPVTHNAIESQVASTSRSKTTVRKKLNNQKRAILLRGAKNRAKPLITAILKEKNIKRLSKSRSIRKSFRKRAAKSDATLRRRLNKRRSSDSFMSSYCPRCGDKCYN